jgi:Transposase DDE domain group 1
VSAGLPGSEHPGVADDRRVGPPRRQSPREEPRQARRAHLLLAVGDQHDVDGQRAATAKRLDARQLAEQLALVVGRATTVEVRAAQRGRERRRTPGRARAGRLDVVVSVDEHRRAPGGAVVHARSRLKDQALAHSPSGQFNANAAWTVIAALAHNLLRWTGVLGLPASTVRAARTLRRRLLALPGRLTSHAGGWTLHLPARWPWQHDFTDALARIRALPTAA